VPLPGLPWSPQFMEAYQAALEAAPRLEIGASRTMPGTVNNAIILMSNQPRSQRWRRALGRCAVPCWNRFRAAHGDKRLAMMRSDHLSDILNILKPSAQRNMLKTLRGLLAFAVEHKMIAVDPSQGVKPARMKDTGGFLTWTEDNIEQYVARHPIGTIAHLAIALLLYTGQRRGDVVRLGRQYVRDGVISFRQSKTGAQIDIPMLPELRSALDAMPASSNMAFMTTEFGKPFTPAGFGGWFRRRCAEAGLPKGLSAHGLRKAAATRLANAGGTAHELMAWFGWSTIAEAERYTRAANRKALAAGVVRKLEARTASVKT
jgi:integrase